MRSLKSISDSWFFSLKFWFHIYGNWWLFKVYIEVHLGCLKNNLNRFEYFLIHLKTECTISQPWDCHLNCHLLYYVTITADLFKKSTQDFQEMYYIYNKCTVNRIKHTPYSLYGLVAFLLPFAYSCSNPQVLLSRDSAGVWDSASTFWCIFTFFR